MGYFPELPPSPPPSPPSPPPSTQSLEFSQTYFLLQLQTVRGEVELDINEKSLQMLVSGIHLTVSAGLKRRLAVDIQTLTQSIRSMLCVLPPLTRIQQSGG